MSDRARHSALSSSREEYAEYVFLGRLCQAAWAREVPLEVLRSATDAFGYDLVLAAAGRVRQVQLKTSLTGGKVARFPINRHLTRQPAGCVLWLTLDPDTLGIEAMRWFGGPSRTAIALPDRIVRYTKGDQFGTKAVRVGMTAVNRGEFDTVDGFVDLLNRLFGPNDASPGPDPISTSAPN